MYNCKFFEDDSLPYLEALISEWLDDMKNVSMCDVHFHYAVRKNAYSVLITYKLVEEEK